MKMLKRLFTKRLSRLSQIIMLLNKLIKTKCKKVQFMKIKYKQRLKV